MEPALIPNFMGEAALKVLDVGEEPLLEALVVEPVALVVEPVADVVLDGRVFVVPKAEEEPGTVYGTGPVDEALEPLDDEVVVDVVSAAMEKPPLVA